MQAQRLKDAAWSPEPLRARVDAPKAKATPLPRDCSHGTQGQAALTSRQKGAEASPLPWLPPCICTHICGQLRGQS